MHYTHVINLDAHLFENVKIKMIRSKGDGHAYINFWIYLLTMGSMSEDYGVIERPDGLPYSVQDLSDISGFHPRIIQEALEIFEDLYMITMKDGKIQLRNWKHYQLMEGYYD